MRITRLKRVTLVIICICVIVAVLIAFFRGTPKGRPQVIGMTFRYLQSFAA